MKLSDEKVTQKSCTYSIFCSTKRSTVFNSCEYSGTQISQTLDLSNLPITPIRLNLDKHFKIKMSDRNFTQYFDVVMMSLSSDRKIIVQQCYICGERCDCSFGLFDLRNAVY